MQIWTGILCEEGTRWDGLREAGVTLNLQFVL